LVDEYVLIDKFLIIGHHRNGNQLCQLWVEIRVSWLVTARNRRVSRPHEQRALQLILQATPTRIVIGGLQRWCAHGRCKDELIPKLGALNLQAHTLGFLDRRPDHFIRHRLLSFLYARCGFQLHRGLSH